MQPGSRIYVAGHLGQGGDAPPPQPPLINIGRGEDCTIEELANRVREAVGFRGDIRWDPGKPDGAPRELLDVSRMKTLGWAPRMALESGIREAYQDFLARYQVTRARC